MMITGIGRLRKSIAVTTVLCMVFAITPINSMAQGISDISGHWAKDEIQSWMDQGLVKGYKDGTFRPDNNITRAEFMSMANGAFGFTETAAISYSDVDKNAWYSAAVAAAKAAGYLSGYPDNTIRPNHPISRAEAASIIMKVNDLEAGASVAAKFADASGFGWSGDAVNAVSAANIMNGYPDGTFKPQNYIKRAEAVAALDKALTYGKKNITYSKPGTYGPAEGVLETEGSVTISVKDVLVQNMIIKGNLIIGKDAGDGSITLKNVTVKGDTKIYGGQNSVIIIDSKLGKVILESEDLTIKISSRTTIETLIVNKRAKITGTGTVHLAYINASGVTFETEPAEMKLAKDIKAPEIGSGGSVGGNSGGGSTFIAVSAVSVSGSAVVGQALTSNPVPADATVTYQWMRSDTAAGIFTGIPGATKKAYILTAEDSNKFIKVKVTGTGNYTGTKTSSATALVSAREVMGYALFEAVNLTDDENLVDLPALRVSGKLPAKVTITDGTTSTIAAITEWNGTFDGMVTGTTTLSAAWTIPTGYTDAIDPIDVTIIVNIVTAQTTKPRVEFEAPTARGTYFAKQQYSIEMVNEIMEALWGTETATFETTWGAIEIMPVFSVSDDRNRLIINADNITQSLLDWLEHDLNTKGNIAVGVEFNNGLQTTSNNENIINGEKGTPLNTLLVDYEDWVGTTVRVNLHNLIPGTNFGGIRMADGRIASFAVETIGRTTQVTSITVTSSATTITADDGILQMNAVVEPSNAYNKTIRWFVENGTGVARISNTGHGTTGQLYAGKNGTVEVIATSAESGVSSAPFLITISGQVGPAAPAGIDTTNETTEGAEDGTLINVSPLQEYQRRGDDENSWIRITGSVVTGLAPGDYRVRIAETETAYAGTPTDWMTIEPGLPTEPGQPPQ